ncbi:MAG: M20 family metallopeptidase [Coprobacillaceae bacterium]
MTIKEYVLKEKEYLITLRRWFHAHPEPSLKEYETCKKIAEELERYNIPYQYISDTAIYAIIKGKKGPGKIVALRSDIDALQMDDLKHEEYASKNPGCCHACGHDAHAATLLTAAKILKEKEEDFSGEIRLFFQPGEEIGAGARIFVNKGLMENVERIFGAHVSSAIDSGKISLTPGPMNASCDYFKIEVTGRGAHVSTPQDGIDALYIASQIVNNLQSIVSRNTAPNDTVIVGIGVLQAGTQYNIIAEHATLEGTTRTFTPEMRDFTNQKVISIATQTAQMYGATVNITFKDFAAPLVNDEIAAKEAYAIAKDIIGKENIITNQQKMLGADDYADFLQKAKGVYAFVGTKNINNSNTSVAHHHGLFDIDEEALLASCNLYIDYALSILNKTEQ